MQITNILTLLLSASLTTAFYIPPRPLAPRVVDTHRGLHSRQVVRDVNPVAPFPNADSSSIPGPVYGFPGDLVDPRTQAPALEAPPPVVPEIETPPVGTPAPLQGAQDLADTYVPVSYESDSSVESLECSRTRNSSRRMLSKLLRGTGSANTYSSTRCQFTRAPGGNR